MPLEKTLVVGRQNKNFHAFISTLLDYNSRRLNGDYPFSSDYQNLNETHRATLGKSNRACYSAFFYSCCVVACQGFKGAWMIKSLIRPFFRAATQVFDPIIPQRIHGASMLLPISHGLGRCVKAHPFYDTALPAFSKFLSSRQSVHRKKLLFVDVGANVGDTAVLVADAVGPNNVEFICIEADPAYIPLLKRNTEKLSAKIFAIALGEYTETRNMQIVHVRRGTSSLADAAEGVAMKTMRLDDVLAEVPRPADILKIDTDGFEGQILRGAEETLRLHAPCLFIEFSPWHIKTYGRETPQAILKILCTAGYKAAVVYDNEGYPWECSLWMTPLPVIFLRIVRGGPASTSTS